MRALRWTVILAAGLWACGERNPAYVPDAGSGPDAGNEGGPCFGNDTCNPGLVCQNGVCVKGGALDLGADAPLLEASPPRPDLIGPRVDAPVPDRSLHRDSRVDRPRHDAAAPGRTWYAMTTAVTGTLRGVWGSSASDVFVVGDSGTILHFDGRKPTSFPWWTAMTSGVSTTLSGIWGARNNNVVAVGSAGKIVHFDGLVWSLAKANTRTFSAVWGSGLYDQRAVDSSAARTRRE